MLQLVIQFYFPGCFKYSLTLRICNAESLLMHCQKSPVKTYNFTRVLFYYRLGWLQVFRYQCIPVPVCLSEYLETDVIWCYHVCYCILLPLYLSKIMAPVWHSTVMDPVWLSILLILRNSYVLSLDTFCRYTFCRQMFCLFIRFVSLYVLSLNVVSFYVLPLHVLSFRRFVVIHFVTESERQQWAACQTLKSTEIFIIFAVIPYGSQ